MSTRVNSALAALEERARQGCPNWETWVISTHDRRLLWSARPDGASVAVITGEESADDLVKAVRKYEMDLPAHLEAARRQLAAVPMTNIGRDKEAILRSLVAALEKLAVRQAEDGEGQDAGGQDAGGQDAGGQDAGGQDDEAPRQ